MAEIIFFEKPGCINNTMQKKLLSDAGHKVISRNILEHEWKCEELLEYFTGLPVEKWFNLSAPSIKSGKINPLSISKNEAIDAMLNEHLLIRRPLMTIGTEHRVGFDYEDIDLWIGLSGASRREQDLESCKR